MVRLGFRTSLFCLITGLAGCSAAGGGSGSGLADADASVEDADQPGRVLDAPTPHDSDSVKPRDGAREGDCACDVRVPGIDIIDGDIIEVVIDVPGGTPIVVASVSGKVKTSDEGVDVTGDVLVDVGGGPVALLDAALRIGAAEGSMPTLDGSATISGELLGKACGCNDAMLPALVSLDIDADADANLGLEVDLPTLAIDTRALPLASGSLELDNAHAKLATDGARNALAVTGDVTSKVAPWSTAVAVQAAGAQSARLRLAGDALVSVEVDGDARLKGETLRSGPTPLASVSLPDAVVRLDRAGATVRATTGASVHPGYSLAGDARVAAKFSPQDWSINVCGAAMTNLLDARAQVATCLDLTRSGAEICADDKGN